MENIFFIRENSLEFKMIFSKFNSKFQGWYNYIYWVYVYVLYRNG